MQTIEKVFVDQDDEIIFVVEKILRAATSRVILVIPATSGVVSSVISLKLLSKQLIDSNKLLILVTDNPTGIKLAGKANLVVRDKISLVDKSAWDEALAIKNELREHKEGIKKELLTSRMPEKVIEEEIIPEVLEEVEPEVPEEPEVIKPVEHTEKEIFGEKPRLSPKIVTMGGIAIASGGDINELKDLSVPAAVEEVKDEKESKIEKSEMISEPEKLSEEKQSANVATRRLKETGPKKKRNIKKLLLIIGLTLLLLLLLFGGAFAYSYKNMAKVEIEVEFNQSEGNINETITVSTLATEVDSENLIVPGTELGLEESSSGDGVATGKKETGTYSQGVIDIRNKSKESVVNLAEGQVFIDISTNLQYVLTQNTTIAVDQYQRDVPIKAKEFGENYNIEDQQSTFRVEGFTTDQLIGFGFRDITGGKTEEITVVTADDVAKVKNSLETAIKGNLQTNLKSQISQGEILLEGSQKFEQVSLEQTVQNDEEAENFSVDLKMKVTAVKLKEEDIRSMAEEIIKKSEKATDQAEIKVDDFEVKNVKVEGTKITFELVAKGEVNENLQLEEQKDQITGKTLDEAKKYLEELEQIEKVDITYKPDYIPENIRKIPSKRENIIFK